ncbi:MAG TPA: VOC family protein [Candidatus Binataceae bacterium]
MEIVCIERVMIAVADVDDARDRWRRAGFAIAPSEYRDERIRVARLAAGAVAIDLCSVDTSVRESRAGSLEAQVRATAARGGGIVGWTWGVRGPIESPDADAALRATRLTNVLTLTATVDDLPQRYARLAALCGANANTVDYLEHIVVMTPVLEDAIAANEALGVPCKRIRDAGRGMRQAFFKLEQTVIEVVGPAPDRPGCWGVAFMCTDIAKAVATARSAGLEATEPKAAIQGGRIARIVAPLDGVAIAFMEAPAPAAS